MTNDSRSERLSLLKAEANRSLRSFLRRNRLVTPRSRADRDTQHRAANSIGLLPAIPPRGAIASSDAVNVNVNLSGGTIFLDDERRVRALAKEIKRLIIEDRRRGLGVGG